MSKLIAAVLVAVAAFGQTPAKTLEFDVASIKPSDPAARGSSIMTDRVGGFKTTNVPLKVLITFAFDVQDFQLSGLPGWAGTERFDVTATIDYTGGAVPPPDPRSMSGDELKTRDGQVRERVRSLLADRFGMSFHRESREQSMYVLEVAKSGHKMKVISEPGERQGFSANTGHIQAFAGQMEQFAKILSSTVGKPVTNRTGLTEKYDFLLEWTPDAAVNAEKAGADAPPSAGGTGPSIFTALSEQLGLRLDSVKGPVDTIVIDHIDRPTAN
jgi:uncharacterized protein (TIGR03435 family)